MKAVKLTKINWNINALPEENREEISKNLPDRKAFTTDDNFDVSVKVPVILKKKYGCDVIDFTFAEYVIAERIEDLLLICKPKGEKEKALFTEAGRLSAYGKKCFERIEEVLEQNVRLKRENMSKWELPKIVDEVLLGIENLTKINTDKATVAEMMRGIRSIIDDHEVTNLKYSDEYDDDFDDEEMDV